MELIADHREQSEELAGYARLCYQRRLVGAAGGNLSVRLPAGDGYLVTASGVSLRDVSPSNLVAVDPAGKKIDGPNDLRPSKEISFHLSVYEGRPAANAVIHVHPPYATAFAAQGRLIPQVTVSSRLKLRQGPLVPVADPGSAELSGFVTDALAAAGEDASVLLLRDHGLIALGDSLPSAFDNAELAADTAEVASHLAVLETSQAQSRRNGLSPWAGPNNLAGRIVDFTAPLNERIQCYPTDPPFAKHWHVTFETAGMCVSKLEMGAHAGTHVDAPLHYLEGGTDIPGMDLERFLGPAVVLDAPKGEGEDIDVADIDARKIRSGDIVLFRTGWEERANSERFFQGEWPGFTPAAIDALLDRKVKAIGGDIASADGPTAIGNGGPAHRRALEAGLPIFEALVNLRGVIGKRFLFLGLPLRIEGGEATPIRAVGVFE